MRSLTQTFTLTFVVTSMLGLGLTTRDIVEPLRNVRFVVMALRANFVIVPAVAYALTRILPLAQDLQIGLIAFSAVAGAPLSINAAQIADGDMRFSVSLIVLQIVVTVLYLPFVLPLPVPGVQVDPVAVALLLVLQILLPLAFGLLETVDQDSGREVDPGKESAPMQQQKAPAPGTAAVGATYILDRGPLRVRATTPCVLLVDTTLDPPAPV